MTDQSEVSLRPNGDGAQVYFNGRLLGDSQCPLQQDQEVTALVVAELGILLTHRDPDALRLDYDLHPHTQC